ncbi:MAG TPA: PilX N-terminal domain-containing pilus assembly protein [Steroidobacteraceae bacterium]|nr:PilX N-terminal domain-containing pilus assembly protein [Steroidobacteraceae bacterium]
MLFTSLILLVILTLVGVMLSRMQMVEEQIALNDQDHQMAIQAAEATLRYAENGLGSTYVNFAGNTAGLYTWASGTEDYYLEYNVSSPLADVLAYGGSTLPVNGTPVFLIESMPAVAVQGGSLSDQQYGAPTPPLGVYRITAYSYGGDQNATAELQEIDGP